MYLSCHLLISPEIYLNLICFKWMICFLQGALYQKNGNLVMAEKVLRDAINIDPTAFQAWWVINLR